MPSEPPPPRAFLKWAGGKASFRATIVNELSRSRPLKTYVEPFVGGGSVALAVLSTLRPERVILGDRNPWLIETYQVVQRDVDGLIERLREHHARHDRDHYYAVRAQEPDNPLDRAAQLIYLNKTCFNGLYRINRSGRFNVPLGRPSHTPPNIADEPTLRAASRVLQGAQWHIGDFEDLLRDLGPGDAAYLDPPYVPLTDTSSFTAYDGFEFQHADQARLASLAAQAVDRGARVVASNHDTSEVRKLYRGFRMTKIHVPRRINRDGGKRAGVTELLMSAGTTP